MKTEEEIQKQEKRISAALSSLFGVNLSELELKSIILDTFEAQLISVLIKNKGGGLGNA